MSEEELSEDNAATMMMRKQAVMIQMSWMNRLKQCWKDCCILSGMKG